MFTVLKSKNKHTSRVKTLYLPVLVGIKQNATFIENAIGPTGIEVTTFSRRLSLFKKSVVK